MKNIKDEKGAIIIEASVALPIYMFLIITILLIINAELQVETGIKLH